MQIKFDKSFSKSRDKSPTKIQSRLNERLTVFYHNPHHPLLKNHLLAGKYQNCHSINITGDWRAIYTHLDDSTIIFIALGTHSQLYS